MLAQATTLLASPSTTLVVSAIAAAGVLTSAVIALTANWRAQRFSLQTDLVKQRYSDLRKAYMAWGHAALLQCNACITLFEAHNELKHNTSFDECTSEFEVKQVENGLRSELRQLVEKYAPVLTNTTSELHRTETSIYMLENDSGRAERFKAMTKTVAVFCDALAITTTESKDASTKLTDLDVPGYLRSVAASLNESERIAIASTKHVWKL
jgi:hypothetical protein